MKMIRVMVVDDSAFSRNMMKELLEEGGCEFAGEADSLEQLLEIYQKCRPDIVTMDIAMPGADGFECSKALKLFDPAVRIVLVSSMKDEELIEEAKKIGILGYVQKPVEAGNLLRVIRNIVEPETACSGLDCTGIEAFKEAFADTLTRMTKTIVQFGAVKQMEKQYISRGIAVVIGISGAQSGSMILDLSEETGAEMARVILRREAKNREEILAMSAEFANVVGGIACSMLNKRDKSRSLRVAPPNVFYGAPTQVVSPSVVIHGVPVNTEYGEIYMGVGFKKESVLWM